MNKLTELYELLQLFDEAYGLEETERIILHYYKADHLNFKTIEDISIKDLIIFLSLETNHWDR